MEYYKISIWINSSVDGSFVCDGVRYSMMLPRLGECIKWNGDYFTVAKIVYDYDDQDADMCASIYVVPEEESKN